MLRPRSIAILGASERAGTVGSQVLRNLRQGGFSGSLYAVNPSRDSVSGLKCFPTLADLPETVEQVIFAVADSRVEAALDETIAHGAKAATIFSTLVLDENSTPILRERVREKLRQSGLLVCGANGMGFYNFHDGVWACGFDTRPNHVRGGNVTLISHSGSGMSGILDCEERIDFNLAVSTGQELSVSMDQYMDYAIDQLDTRVIGLFMETTRHPERLVAVLAKAAERHIPVVALKVGRTELAARLTVSHSGAMAGQDAAFQAVFDRYGVQRVEDMDELTTALIMFAQPHRPAAGGLVAIHDSGGERQLLIDLADRVHVPLAAISKDTEKKLADALDPGLLPVNPLDAWSKGGPDYHLVMEHCFATLMADENAGMGAVVHDRAPHGAIYADYITYLRSGHAASGKPAFLVANHQGTGTDPLVRATTQEGFPVLDGLRSFLVGARCLFAYRDFQERRTVELEKFKLMSAKSGAGAKPKAGTVARWATLLAAGAVLDEFTSGQLLADFGVPVNPSLQVNDAASLLQAAAHFGYPLVLKSAQPGLLHKTDRGGVRLNLRGEGELLAAYEEMSQRLGPLAVVSRMIPGHGVSGHGVEMLLGVVRDEQFGPLVLMGFGGILVETMKDIACALPPFDAATARRLVDKLQQRPLLDAHRGQPAADIDAFCETASRLSQLAVALGEVVAEIDINPIRVHAKGCVALDALVAGRRKADNEPRAHAHEPGAPRAKAMSGATTAR